MAYKKVVHGRSYPHLYNVTMAVGSRKSLVKTQHADPVSYGTGAVMTQTTYTSSYEPNKRDDVMLVQYLLKRVYQRGHAAEPQLNQGNGTTELKIDGLHGPKTQKAIEQFQLEMRRNGRNIATDGCVDPELGHDAMSSISQTGYTISWLNKYFWVLWPELAPDIRFNPECPAELKLAFCDGSV